MEQSVGKKFEKLKDGEKSANVRDYQAAFESMMYAAIATRPDISSAVGVLSQFSSNQDKRISRKIRELCVI